MSNTDKGIKGLNYKEELEKLYQIYKCVQSGDKSALGKLFKSVQSKVISKADVLNKEYRMSNMDNVLDVEMVIDNEKNEQKREWVDSADSKVVFQFSCLNKMLYKNKKKFLSGAKNTGYENGVRKKNNHSSKYYEGKYDISDFNELMYETIVEIFNAETDENHCLTLDGKKNNTPIYDGVSLLKNISYFTSRKINKRAKTSYMDISDREYYHEEVENKISGFDQYAYKKFLQADSGQSRLMIYAEYLEWFKRNDPRELFKVNACDIRAIIETIMNCENTFVTYAAGDSETGFGMKLVKQETLQEIVRYRHDLDIDQENISKDLEVIEQRLLDHLLYSLNYRIDKAEKSKGIYEKESERYLYEMDKKIYFKIFSRRSLEIYDKSVFFTKNILDGDVCNCYFRTIKKYEDIVLNIVSLEKGNRMYDMVKLILSKDDLEESRKEALSNIANTIIDYYQKKEAEYRKNQLKDFILKGFSDWRNSYWEAELKTDVLKIQLWSSKNVKKPIRHSICKEKLLVYCGYKNYYFCDTERSICYSMPKDRRIISRSNKDHEIFMYNVG